MQIITPEQRTADLADAVVGRTHEVYGYEINVANYQQMLTTLPTEWPAHLAEYRGMEPHAAAVACPNEHLEQLALLQQGERVSALLSTEIVERAKAQNILDALIAQLPAEGSDDAIAAAIARRDAALSGSN
jgi:antitoxin component of MazEF toxin-antitoxin module